MVGGIKASSPGMMSMSADMFLDLPTMSAPSGEERKLGRRGSRTGRARWAMPPPLQRTAEHSRVYTLCAPLKRLRLKFRRFRFCFAAAAALRRSTAALAAVACAILCSALSNCSNAFPFLPPCLHSGCIDLVHLR